MHEDREAAARIGAERLGHLVEDRTSDRKLPLLTSPEWPETVGICGVFVLATLDKFAAIFRIALMGAEEQTERSEDVPALNLSESIQEKLDRGWTLREDQTGQILLVPPSRYGDPA